MKTLTFFLLLAFYVGCSDNVIQIEDSKENGNILLKIDKETAPSSVVYVKAYLTRENYQTISSYLNVQSDSTADLWLSDIYVGTWHLKVDAEDINGIVRYTGETDVEIIEGETTQIFLTLQSTGVGTGSIYIYVNWGGEGNNSEWIDYQDNPIIATSNNYYDYYGVFQPVVIYDEGIYKMWYMGSDFAGGGRGSVLYAVSQDGLTWTPFANNPVMKPEDYYVWDSQNVQPGAVIKEDGIYKMYYSGFSDSYGYWYIGLATSTDGITWEKYSNPILSPSSNWEYQMVASAIVKFNNVYYLYYTGRNLPTRAVGVATSIDGINFTKYSGNPILTNTKLWEEEGVLDASVIEENSQLKMVYMNSNGTGFGIATSTDGFNWTKANDNPFVTNQNTADNWASGKIAYPFWLKLSNETRIYYCGVTVYDDILRIGFMRKSNN